MHALFTIAAKEVREALRNRWVIAATLLLAVLALTLSFLGSAPVGAVKASSLVVTIVSLSSLTIFLLPLIALLLSHDAIVGEIERGTMVLLLAYPVARWHVVLGKFIGHLVIISIATVIGYGTAGGAVALASELNDSAAWHAFEAMVGSSILLGASFLSLGYLVSVIARERALAGGIAIGLWLLFVLVYDIAILGVLVADQGRTITITILDALLLLNPADLYRLLNLSSFSNVRALSGMAGLARDAQLGAPILVAALACWIVIPLAAAAALFARRQI